MLVRATAAVWFLPQSWSQTALVSQACLIPGLEIVDGPGGIHASRFDALTSGLSGGITGARSQ